MNEAPIRLADHLQELRQRVLVSLAAVVATSSLAYAFAEEIARFFMRPLFGAHPLLTKLVYTSLPEAFLSYIKLALLVGLGASLPVIGYQAWMYISPGLYRKERRLGVAVMFWATALFFAGVLFAFFGVLPRALVFLMSFVSEGIEPLPRLDGYLTFVARTCLGFGLSFELPFLMVVAGKVGLFSRERFRKRRLASYLSILTLAFLLAGGDVLATGMLAVPLIGLFEAGLLVMALF